MAVIAAGIGVPHTPLCASIVDPQNFEDETARFGREITDQLEASKTDVLTMFSTDHLNIFFVDNLPALAVGVASRTSGPNDSTPGLCATEIDVPEVFAVFEVPFFRDCLLDGRVREVALSNPTEPLRDYDLADCERELMLGGRVGELKKLGADFFLLSYRPRWGIFWLDVHVYNERMRAVVPDDQQEGEEQRG